MDLLAGNRGLNTVGTALVDVAVDYFDRSLGIGYMGGRRFCHVALASGLGGTKAEDQRRRVSPGRRFRSTPRHEHRHPLPVAAIVVAE